MYVCMYRTWAILSIFQILFTDIHIRHSFVYSICVASQSNILVSLSFTSQSWSQHPYFKIQYSTSLIQHYALTIQHIHFKYYSHSTFVCVFYLNLCSIECLVCVCCGAECDMLATQSSTFLFGHWTFLFPCRPFSHACLRILRLMSGVRRPDWRVRRPDWRHHTILTSHKPILLEGPRKENPCSLAFTLQESNHREPFPRRGPGTFTLRVVPCCH